MVHSDRLAEDFLVAAELDTHAVVVAEVAVWARFYVQQVHKPR